MASKLAAVTFGSLIATCFSFALAQGTEDMERKKAHIVSRIYQATYGAEKRCSTLNEASITLADAVKQFRLAYAEITSLVEQSPYFPVAEKDFTKFLASQAAREDKEELKAECAGLEDMLRQFVKFGGDKQAFAAEIQLLKK